MRVHDSCKSNLYIPQMDCSVIHRLADLTFCAITITLAVPHGAFLEHMQCERPPLNREHHLSIEYVSQRIDFGNFSGPLLAGRVLV
ncbi:hypothetical protein A0H81_09287 [Grifola frondosa]|uniref:Uncharacterized protein n=1 Tax=Grifola frondosa TaxID=5627 RepID=A0A1C7M1D4_GRIFR|nr:hypothetical protein A0H81_09287 [Grifola frondosa]